MKNCRPYSNADLHMMRELYKKGYSYERIAGVLGRTTKAVEVQVSRRGWIEKKAVKPAPKKKSASYIRYEKPKTSISLFWGLIKYEKA